MRGVWAAYTKGVCVCVGRLRLAWMRRKASGSQLITDTGWGLGGGVLSLIKLSKVWWEGGTYSHSDGLVFTTLWPTAIFLPSSLVFSYGADSTKLTFAH